MAQFDTDPMIAAAVGGGLGAVFGALAGRYLRGKPRAAQAMLAAAVVVGAQLGQTAILPALQARAIRAETYKGVADEFGEQVAEIFMAEVGDVVGSPQFRAAIEHDHPTVSPHAWGRQLAARGACRLSAPELNRIWSLRSHMAQASSNLCAELWTGTVTDANLSAALAQLSPEDLHEYFHLTGHAMLAELNDSPPVRKVSSSEVKPVSRTIRDSLSQPEREVFGRARSPLASPADQCAALRAFTNGASALSDEARATLLLSMMCAAGD